MIPKDEFEALLRGVGIEGEKETLPRGPALSREEERQKAAAAGHFPPGRLSPAKEGGRRDDPEGKI